MTTSTTHTTTPERYPLWLPPLANLIGLFRDNGYSIKRDHTPKLDALDKVGYADLRSTIQDGDLLFCGGEYAFSKVIRYLSGRSKVSHVGIVYWWNGRLMLLESVETDGVRIVPVSQYIRNYENSGKGYDGRIYLARDTRLATISHEDLAATKQQIASAVATLLGSAADNLNKKFSLKDTVLFFMQGCTGRFRHVGDDEFLCSEFVAKCFAALKLAYPDDGRGFVAPEHIAMSPHVAALCEIALESA